MIICHDARYALRLLRRAPGFSAIAIATLALGIGGSTAMFTIVDSVLLRPLSFAEPDRLAMISPSSGSRLSPEYLDRWRLQNRTFVDMAGWHDVRVNLTGDGEPLELLADRVTPNFFALLGTPAIVGRTFVVGSTPSEVEPEVILSHGLWQRRYGGDPDVVGQAMTLDGERLTIVGVMPAGFTIRTTELSESRAEIWLPLRLATGTPLGMGGFLHVVARLAPGVTFDQAEADVSLIARRIEEANPSYSSDWTVAVVPLRDATVTNVRLTLLVLLGGVGILLLITCANVAHLVLGRAVARQTEVAVRLSLGATGGRLARQFMTESLVLAGIGGTAGVLVAVWGTELLVSSLPAGIDVPRTREIGVDLGILVLAVVVTLLTAVLFGLVPLSASGRSAEPSVFRDVVRGSSAGRRGSRIGGALIVSEVALAVVLLAGAGLLGRSFRELVRVDPGFRAEQVLTMRTTLPATTYDADDRIRTFSADLLERIGNLPGVVAAGSVNYLPMSRFGAADRFEIVGRPETRFEDQKFSWVSVVGGRYFEAMRIPLLRGRLPGDADTGMTEPVFVIDEELARRDWPGGDAIGARLVWGSDVMRDRDAGGTSNGTDDATTGEIVGVVGSVRWAGMATPPQATAYFWFPQSPGREITVVTRTTGDPASLAAAIAAQVGAVDSNQPVADVRAMQELVSSDLARPRFTMAVLGGFAGAALLLAAIGLYGVMAFAVTQRTREIGVRVALGANRGDILRLVMRRGLLLTGGGLAIGLAAALALGRVVESLLYGVTPGDPVTLAAVTLLLPAVASVAAYLPARRATRVDPVVALRAE